MSLKYSAGHGPSGNRGAWLLLTSMTIKNTEKVADNVTGGVLNVEDGGVGVLHANTPSLHLRDCVEDGVIAARRRGLLRDGLRECLTHVVGRGI